MFAFGAMAAPDRLCRIAPYLIVNPCRPFDVLVAAFKVDKFNPCAGQLEHYVVAMVGRDMQGDPAVGTTAQIIDVQDTWAFSHSGHTAFS